MSCLAQRRLWTLLVLLVLLVLLATPALAQNDAQQSYKGIIDTFHNAVTSWQGTLSSIALKVFWYLAGIEFCWVNISLALRGGDFSDFVSTNTKVILSIGVFLAFLTNALPWSEAIVNSFANAGQQAVIASGGSIGAGVGKFDPSYVLQEGLNIASAILKAAPSAWSLGSFIIVGLSALILVLCFVYLAAIMACAMVECYIIGGAVVLLLGFGGASWTSDIAKRSMMFALSCGAKLFIINLIIGSAISVVNQWATAYQSSGISTTDAPTCFGLVGIAFLICCLAKNIPDLVQAALNGAVPGHGAAMSTLAAAGAAAAAL